MDLKLPKGGTKPGKVELKDRQIVEISPQGTYKLNGRQMALVPMLDQLKLLTRSNPNAFIAIRTDKRAPSEFLYAVIDGCQKREMTRFQLPTAPE